MSVIQYEIVFYGTLAVGFSKQQTQEHVAQLFKTTIDQVERMFTGNRVVIRNKLDSETALKYIVAMKKRGAECQVEAMGEPGVKVDLVSAQEHSANTNVPSSPESPQQKHVETLHGSLPVAGEKVDDILASTHFELAPAGVRLSDNKTLDDSIVISDLSEFSLAPTGSDLRDKKQEIPVAVPDTSHLKVIPQ